MANEIDLNGDCIMLCRQFLAGIGIERTFFDDCVAAACDEILKLRAQHQHLMEACKEAASAAGQDWLREQLKLAKTIEYVEKM